MRRGWPGVSTTVVVFVVFTSVCGAGDRITTFGAWDSWRCTTTGFSVRTTTTGETPGAGVTTLTCASSGGAVAQRMGRRKRSFFMGCVGLVF